MPQPSSSQEVDIEFVTWHVPDAPPIHILRRVMDAIHTEVSEAFATAPHRSAETGGILLGRRTDECIIIEDFEPVPSEHRFGPCYRLSETDLESLRETLEWFRNEGQPGITVLGYYRSQTLPDFALCPDEDDLLRTYFEQVEDLVLLIKPGFMGSSAEDFCIQRSARGAPAPLPCPPAMAWPAPRPRLEPEPEQERRPRRSWPWYVAAVTVGLVGGVFGYLWLHPETGRLPIALPAPATPASPQLQPIVEGAPVPVEPDTAGIHLLLDRWSEALKRGDAETASECYAPVVTTYFTRHDVSRDAVRQNLQQSRERYGRLDVYRLSGLGITPLSESRAVATFRKRWKTSGKTRSAGEEEERMTLVRNQAGWQISSEQTGH